MEVVVHIVELEVENIVKKVIESNVDFLFSQEREEMRKSLTTLIAEIVTNDEVVEDTIAATVNRFLIEKGIGVLNESKSFKATQDLVEFHAEEEQKKTNQDHTPS